MKREMQSHRGTIIGAGAAFFAVLIPSTAVNAAPYINEVLFKLPGGGGLSEYVELRGTPGQTLSNTYLVAIEGDSGAAATVGDVREIFDLGGKSFGSNGMLVLLENGNSYSVNPAANAYTNANSSGFGSGGAIGSTIGHSGDGDITNLSNPSVTFMLIQASTAPTLSGDIDTNDDGVPDGAVYSGWNVLDAVGILDNTTGAADKGYGLINFKNSAGTGSGSNLVPGSFTADYIGRVGNSTGSAASDWVAGNVVGTAPDFSLSSTDVSQPTLAGAPLNHIGSANPVPEPACAGFVGMLAFAVTRRRRHC